MIASGIVTAIGLVQQGVAASTQTRADDRYWDSLPDSVHVFTHHMKPDSADSTMTVRFLDPNGRELSRLRQETKVEWDTRGNGFAWARSRPAFGKKTVSTKNEERDDASGSRTTSSGDNSRASDGGRRPSTPD